MPEALPLPDRDRLAANPPGDGELVTVTPTDLLVRVGRSAGQHPMPWNALRHHGPVPEGRFDHHEPPKHDDPVRSVTYVCDGPNAFVTALAETFQASGGTGVAPIDLTADRRFIVTFQPSRRVVVLDLASGWTTRAQANALLWCGPRSASQAWARAIYDAYPQVEGLRWPCPVHPPGRSMALWDRAADAMPARPLALRYLDDPAIKNAIANAALTLGTYPVNGWASPP